ARIVGQCGRHLANFPAPVARFDDFAGELVAKDGPVRNNEYAGMGRVQVGAADAAIMNLENDLAAAGLRIFHVFDAQRFAQFVKNGGLHLCRSSCRGGSDLEWTSPVFRPTISAYNRLAGSGCPSPNRTANSVW